MPGFTCGSDPTLETGTKIVIKNVPTTGYSFDHRLVNILKTGQHGDLENALTSYKDCPTGNRHATCEPIQLFQNGCHATTGTRSDDFVVFNNAFTNGAGCGAKIIDHNGTDTWIEEYKLYLGYDDLVKEVFGEKSILDVHRIYEISCNIEKIGSVETGFELQLFRGNVDLEDTIGTEFKIEKIFRRYNTRREYERNPGRY